jgi:C1A family cysteine protease
VAEKDEGRMDVAELAATLDQEGARWEAGPTFLTELPYEERKMYLGFEPPGSLTLKEIERTGAAIAAGHEAAAAEAVGYPASFDWRNYGGQNYITPVKNQGGCGSCVAFGTTATVEGTFRVQRGNPNLAVDLSEASLFYCIAKSQGRTCATGWWPTDALNGYQNTGVPDEACFPYTAGDQNCTQCADWAARVVKITAWHSVAAVADMKTWLSTRGPLSACFTVYNDFFAYTSGVYHHVSGAVAGGHCVSIVGYDDTQSCWICKNSWGTGWGESGFFRIGYGECGIEGYVQAVDGIVETGWLSNVKIVGLWTIDQDRNAWAYVAGVGWRKIAPDNDVIFYNMLAQLIEAKAGGQLCSLYQESGVIKQIYVF